MLLTVANILAPWIARLTVWVSGKRGTLALSCIAVMWCVLGLLGSGFDYSIADAAAASEDALIDTPPDVIAWSSMVGDMFLASLASVVAGVTVLALSLWMTPSATARVIPTQRRGYDVYDAAD